PVPRRGAHTANHIIACFALCSCGRVKKSLLCKKASDRDNGSISRLHPYLTIGRRSILPTDGSPAASFSAQRAAGTAPGTEKGAMPMRDDGGAEPEGPAPETIYQAACACAAERGWAVTPVKGKRP